MDPKAARDKRNWTIYATSARMKGVSRSSLQRLEAEPTKIGPELKLRTALEVVRVYWPDVRLEDLGIRKTFPLKIMPRDGAAEKKLRYGSE